MQITHPVIISYKVMGLESLMQAVDELDGDYLVAYALAPDGSCSNDVLVLETDVYSDADDEFLEFKGQKYNWEVELYSLKSIKTYFSEQSGNASSERLVEAAKYFLINRAYLS
ncbi:hypothetical protein EBB79_18660 [Parasedimentitalea marina]|uniref:Uncharacterized protein n=2 Tax=Parasedimentitalea marina TaxID=2483033 RepID=A0A3T0N6M1_9RHOB|nr:hypothetical protein EBB79_18660 [Parasedimentitalea marina]